MSQPRKTLLVSFFDNNDVESKLSFEGMKRGLIDWFRFKVFFSQGCIQVFDPEYLKFLSSHNSHKIGMLIKLIIF